jgi:hypothetical protein
MAVTLIKETGAGLTNANSYASVADGDAYANERLRATDWTAATSDDKARALIMATRLIDQEIQFNGYKGSQTQALQWPRRLCPDPDSDQLSIILGGSVSSGPYLPENVVPLAVVQATCEMAIQNLKAERLGDSQGEGIKSLEITGALAVEFSQGAAPLAITRDVQNLLAKYGRVVGAGGGVVKLSRV